MNFPGIKNRSFSAVAILLLWSIMLRVIVYFLLPPAREMGQYESTAILFFSSLTDHFSDYIAHITLIPPFWMQPDLEKVLIDSIKEFSAGTKGFSILLKDFSCFQPKVIFTNVEKNEELLHLKQDLEQFLLSANKFPINKDDRVFHPHVTLATRDLYKKAFYEAWEYFKEKKYEAQWHAEGLSLLRHNQKKWDVIATSHYKTLL